MRRRVHQGALLLAATLVQGCVVTGWASALVERTYPPQAVSVVAVRPRAPGAVVDVVVRATDGGGEQERHTVDLDTAATIEDVRASSHRFRGEGYLDTRLSHIPEPLPLLDVEVRDREHVWRRVASVPPIARERSIPSEALGFLLLPFAVTVDLLLFPAELILLVAR